MEPIRCAADYCQRHPKHGHSIMGVDTTPEAHREDLYLREKDEDMEASAFVDCFARGALLDRSQYIRDSKNWDVPVLTEVHGCANVRLCPGCPKCQPIPKWAEPK